MAYTSQSIRKFFFALPVTLALGAAPSYAADPCSFYKARLAATALIAERLGDKPFHFALEKGIGAIDARFVPFIVDGENGQMGTVRVDAECVADPESFTLLEAVTAVAIQGEVPGSGCSGRDAAIFAAKQLPRFINFNTGRQSYQEISVGIPHATQTLGRFVVYAVPYKAESHIGPQIGTLHVGADCERNIEGAVATKSEDGMEIAEIARAYFREIPTAAIFEAARKSRELEVVD